MDSKRSKSAYEKILRQLILITYETHVPYMVQYCPSWATVTCLCLEGNLSYISTGGGHHRHRHEFQIQFQFDHFNINM